ncbi:B9 domain-containing protein 1 isoform X1 [Anticarsia gemmatalis]|uniref:B9 domain-containing protein 1 isoform X1 n=1 Tax=Anticarsia gemmatalis TaxID=129554 RepID=UPI003F759777
MKDSEITKFLVCFSGQIEYVTFPGGVFDDQLYVHYEAVWGPDWNPMSGLTSGTSQMARSGVDPERVVFNLPIEMVFSSTNVSGWPQLLITVRAQNTLTGNALRGYSLFLMPPTTGHVMPSFAPLIRPRAATVLGEWLAWLTGRYPELADPKMLAIGKDNYLLRTESYGSVTVSLNMVSKDLRKLGYDNQPPAIKFVADT